MAGAEALSGTLFIYGVTELLHGYGFLAVFVGALALRQFEWKHDYHRKLNDYAVMVERLLMAAVLVLFGGAIAWVVRTAYTGRHRCWTRHRARRPSARWASRIPWAGSCLADADCHRDVRNPR